MRREQRAAADSVVQMLDDRPSQRHAVVSARAAADLVKDHQAAVGGHVQNAGRFGHLDHECALPAGQLVARSDTGEDAIRNTDHGLASRHETADLSQKREQSDLADICALARHIRTGD